MENLLGQDINDLIGLKCLISLTKKDKNFDNSQKSKITLMSEENTQHIKQVIAALRKDRKLKKGLEKAQIKKLWRELMSETIDKFTSEISYANGTLNVYLTSSAMREELNRGKDKIINLINQELGEDLIKKIVFK